jgi:hypothetical protein
MVLPESFSRLRKRFSSRKLLLVNSSLSAASQLSSSVSISSLRSSRCSSVNLATHASLSNLGAAGWPTKDVRETGAFAFAVTAPAVTDPLPLAAAAVVVVVEVAVVCLVDTVATGLGALKKEAIFPLILGFLASSAARSAALRLRVMARRRLWRRSSSLEARKEDNYSSMESRGSGPKHPKIRWADASKSAIMPRRVEPIYASDFHQSGAKPKIPEESLNEPRVWRGPWLKNHMKIILNTEW